MLSNCPGARRLSGSFFGNLLLIVLGFLFGEILLFLIMFLEDDPGTWFCMGTVIALVMLLVTTVLFYGVGYTGAFSLALSMNCTRRQFLLDYSGKILAHLVLGYLLVLGLYLLELLIGHAAFPDYPLEAELSFLTDWRFVLAGIDERGLLQAVRTAVALEEAGDGGIQVPDYADENVSAKVVRIVQSYAGVVDKTVWRKG